MRPVFLSIVAMCVLAPPAAAWDEAGHKVTAKIAFDLLSDTDQQNFVRILRAHPRFNEDFISRMPEEIPTATQNEQSRWLFAQASIWPDIIRDRNYGEKLRQRYHRGTWHYINLPVYLTEQDEKEYAGQLEYNVSAEFIPPLRHDLNLIQALKGNVLLWRDATASDSERAIALCWILHLTGDVHEPLHNVAMFSRTHFPEGDFGGNIIVIKREPKDTNLHSVWDGLAIHLDDYSPDESTREILANDVADIQSIADWARAGQELADKIVYGDEVRAGLLGQAPSDSKPEITLSAHYLETAANIARPLVFIAGHRIAALLTN